MIDYSKAKTYKLINDIDDYVYVGSTTQPLCKRMAKHHKNMKNSNKKNSNLYILMNKYGVSHFQIILIRDVPCKNREEMLREERREFDNLDVKNRLNQIRPILSTDERNGKYKEYRSKNKDNINKRRRETRAYDKLMQELPFYRVSIPVGFG